MNWLNPVVHLSDLVVGLGAVVTLVGSIWAFHVRTIRRIVREEMEARREPPPVQPPAPYKRKRVTDGTQS